MKIKGGDNMVGENDQPISEKQGYPRNEEFNYRKGEDNYALLFANNKIQYDNAMANSQSATATANLALQQAVSFQQKSNELYLGQMDAREKAQNANIGMRSGISESEQTQRLEHEDEHDLHQRDNDRMTLEELYNLSPEEAAAIVPVMSALLDILAKKQPKQ
jgi:hypothetical protein